MIKTPPAGDTLYHVQLCLRIGNHQKGDPEYIIFAVNTTLTPEQLEHADLEVQAVHRCGEAVHDYQCTQSLQGAMGYPIDRAKTGMPCQTEHKF